jgi:hypothetical protein
MSLSKEVLPRQPLRYSVEAVLHFDLLNIKPE